ncbi:lysyl-tRNA synthetase, class II [Actinidia rufa]|uniref:Lysyl-tRNA synthetase n=1 Tax=Actinidia rufa TaxID=165716 RepID=A0A7J0HCF5_9ERIC|nr:lysyl-tRNA synthetase, class II [Actinidia rufa]
MEALKVLSVSSQPWKRLFNFASSTNTIPKNLLIKALHSLLLFFFLLLLPPPPPPRVAGRNRRSSTSSSPPSSTSDRDAVRAIRLKKVQELRSKSLEPYAYKWDRTHTANQLQDIYKHLGNGEESNSENGYVSVAGRIVARRAFGKLAFLTLRDDSGIIQLYCEKERLANDQFELLKTIVDIGDILGAIGTMKRTEKGVNAIGCWNPCHPIININIGLEINRGVSTDMLDNPVPLPRPLPGTIANDVSYLSKQGPHRIANKSFPYFLEGDANCQAREKYHFHCPEKSLLLLRIAHWELSVNLNSFAILTKSLLPLPDKYHGLTDVDKRYRQRYVDMIANPEVADIFRQRAKIVSEIRKTVESIGFVEVETPVFTVLSGSENLIAENPIPSNLGAAGGAEARPFVTHHNSLGRDLYLRIATELHLKRMLVGGFEKVYEMGRIFRNEGISTRHNPEFTTIEMYEAYSDYQSMMNMAEEIVSRCALAVHGKLSIEYQGVEICLERPWRRETMHNLVKEVTGIDFIELGDDLTAAKEVTIRTLGASLEHNDKCSIEACQSVGHVLNEVNLLLFAPVSWIYA